MDQPLQQPTTPGDLKADGKLKIGVVFCNKRYRGFTIGPLTVEAELAAEATMPDWIDPDLIYGRYVESLTDEKRAELKIDPPARELTADERRRAGRMQGARYAHECIYRVTMLGLVPREQIPQALGRLLSDDLDIVVAKAREVDKAEARFRDEDKDDVDEGAGTGGGGDRPGGDFEVG
jgi:hypothetical protein